MRIVEHIGRALLILGDCREELQGIKAGVIVTDPVWPNCPANSIPGWDRPWELWAEACAHMVMAHRIVVCLRCDSDPRFLASLPPLPFFRSIQMPYVMPGYIGRKLGGDEIAYWFGTPIAWARNRTLVPGRAPSAQPHARAENGHPMSRSQTHFDWLLNWCSDEGETVLDPFMGSGTTGVACMKAGRPFVGIEIEPRFFDIACRRIEAAMRQGDMLVSSYIEVAATT